MRTIVVRAGRVLTAAAFAIAFVGLHPSAAFASSGGVSGGVLTYNATNNENQDVVITSSGAGQATLKDWGTFSMSQTGGCVASGGNTLACTGVTSIVLNLGNFGDIADWTAVSYPVTFNGSSGADEAYGGSGNDTLNMGTGGDYAEAGAGSDTIVNDSGTDTAYGQAGDDTFNESADDFSDDYLWGGAGTDTVSYAGRTERVDASLDGVQNDGEVGESDNVESDIEHITGGAGNDTLVGSDLAANILIGNDGNDVLQGLGGGDSLQGGVGEDFLDGGTGNDTLAAGGDADTVSGGSGADAIDAGDGNDTIDGGDQNDTIDTGLGGADVAQGGLGDDTITDPATGGQLDGGLGDDTITSTGGGATLFGREGSDLLNGGAAADALKGGDGSDILQGGGGDDTLDGGLGADVLGGGDGTDTADYAGRVAPLTVTLDDVSNDGEPSEYDNVLSDVENVHGGWGNDSITGSASDNILTDGSAGNDVLDGQGGNDTLIATGGADTLLGGDGNDVMLGGTGNDSFTGGAGVDQVSYADHTADVTVSIDALANDGQAGEADSIALDVENLLGGPGNDALIGSAFANDLNGGSAGNDTLVGGSGSDTYAGGSGGDTVSYAEHTSDVSATIDGTANDGAAGELENIPNDVENLTGGSGNDTLLGTTSANVFVGGGGTDTVSYADHSADTSLSIDGVANDGSAGELDNIQVDVENLIGGSGTDTMTGSAVANVLNAGAGGNDTMNGLAGNDTLIGGSGNDTFDAGDGADTMTGGAGDDVFAGGNGTDTVSYVDHAGDVTASIDNLANDGSAGELDNIQSDVENLTGGVGNDTLAGSSGANALNGGSAGNDTLIGGAGTDTYAGGVGVDTVSYVDHLAAVTASMDGVANDGATGENENVPVDIENLAGGSGSDTLTGNTVVNALWGNDGNDTLVGAGGTDTFAGGNGTDTVSYADHATAVTASLDGAANDGSAGENENIPADVENLTGGSANDTLIGNTFTNSFSGGGGVDTVSYADHLLPVTVTIDGTANDGQSGEFDNVATDVENLIGGSGNDSLTGSSAANVFDGGTGADVLKGLGGIDTVTYASRTQPLVVTIDNKANDGEVGELDNVFTDIENLIGGSGADKLTGSKAANALTGGKGADTIVGGSGNDTIYARDKVKDTLLDGGLGTDSAQVDKTDVKKNIEILLK